MTQETKLKPYQVLLLSCVFCTILILNSNYVNNKRALAKREKEQEQLFNRLITRRQLSEENVILYSESVCKLASDELNKYYETGQSSEIGLEDQRIECEDKDKSYMKSLISIVRSATGDGDEEENEGHSNLQDNYQYNGSGETTSEDSDEGINTDDIIDYAIGRLLAMVVFIFFGIFGIIGWIVCCACCCCNCCCCCCCKKPECKIPCFIFTYVFYALVIVVCIYGLAMANKIFKGLGNVECSLLKFFEQVVNGETKQDLPRWAGVTGINDLLTNINSTINALAVDSKGRLNSDMDQITLSRTNFEQELQNVGKNFYDNGNYKAPYMQPFTGTLDFPLNGNYIYQTVIKFGKYENGEYTPDSFLDMWNTEYSTISDNAYEYLTDANEDFNNILGENIDQVHDALGDGVSNLDEITGTFNNVSENLGEIFDKYSGEIDKYGKMGVKIVFGVIMLMNIFLAALLILICLFSGKACTGCCCVRCLFKFCTHILWNVLALFMILSFIIGGLIALVGRIGGDMMSLVTFIISEDNFNDNKTALLIGEIGEAKNYIQVCIHGDGDIAGQLGLGNSLDSFEGINSVEGNITQAINNFTDIINRLPVYYGIINYLESQKNYTIPIFMQKEGGGENDGFLYSMILEKLNGIVQENEKWSTEKENDYSCGDSKPEGEYYYPQSCKPKAFTKYYPSNSDFKAYADIIERLDNIVDYANKPDPSPSSGAKSVRQVVDELKIKYNNHLNGYLNVLRFFNTTINRITSLIREYTGDGQSAFAFLNGKFIGINIKIILKYLQSSLGKDFYTVGVCLCIVGLSLILSISSTILLIVVINVELKKNEDEERNANNRTRVPPGVPEYQQNIPSPYGPRNY